MTPTPPQPPPPDGTVSDRDNPLSPAFWQRPTHERQALFKSLRDRDTPAFLRRPASGPWKSDDGFHALTRYHDVAAADRNTTDFGSEPTSISLDNPAQGHPDDASIVNVDNPRHARIRRIAARAFSAKRIDSLDEDMRAIARRIVDGLLERGPCDFVAHGAGPLPLEVVCVLTGIPESARAAAIRDVDTFFQALDADSRIDPEELAAAVASFRTLMSGLARTRAAHPTDDLISALVNPPPGEEAMSEHAVVTFMSALIGAGIESVRQTLAQALILLTENPTQRQLLLSDLPALLPDAIEEFLRHAAPGSWVRRTVKHPVRIREHTFHPGDKVLLFIASANMDETVFEHPEALDLRRNPNPHLSFGAPNPHYCLGARLARREIAILLTELLTRIPDIRATAPPTRLSKGLLYDITHLPCALE